MQLVLVPLAFLVELCRELRRACAELDVSLRKLTFEALNLELLLALQC